jgi:serine/threonine protein kinase
VEGRTGLPKGTLLDGSYRIERVIGSGGFGITYEAEDMKLGTKVAIKEYYPGEFGRRDDSLSVQPTSEMQKATFEWGRTSFLQEARTLARFRHPSIVQVTRVFEAHSTAYMVMIFEQGQNFEVWLKRLGRAPTQDELDRIAGPLLDALEMMHGEHFLHRDIAPDNVIVRADGTPILLDFGAARRAVAEMTRALTGIVKTGYSPHEQYATDGRLQGPWTDLYALGATLYRAVAGKSPEEATLRVTDDRLASAAVAAKGTYRPSFLTAIDACLKVQPSERPQSVAQLRPMLLAPAHMNTARFAETRKMGERKPALAQSARRTKRWWAAAAVLALVGGISGGLLYTRWDAEKRGKVEAEAKRTAEQKAQRQTDAAAPKASSAPLVTTCFENSDEKTCVAKAGACEWVPNLLDSVRGGFCRSREKLTGVASCIASRISASFPAGSWHRTTGTSWQCSCDAGDEAASHAGDGVGDVSLRPQRRRLWICNPREGQVAGGEFRSARPRGEWRPSRRSGSRRLRCTWWRDGGSRANLALRSGRARPPA